MIFGIKNSQLGQWRRRYAWAPQVLSDGRMIWFERYWIRWRVNLAGFSYPELVLEPYEDAPRPTTPPVRR
jgi:hypothetical protein